MVNEWIETKNTDISDKILHHGQKSLRFKLKSKLFASHIISILTSSVELSFIRQKQQIEQNVFGNIEIKDENYSSK